MPVSGDQLNGFLFFRQDQLYVYKLAPPTPGPATCDSRSAHFLSFFFFQHFGSLSPPPLYLLFPF